MLLAALLAAGCTPSQQLRMTRTQDATVIIDSPEGLCWSANVGMATREGCGRDEISVHDDTGVFSSNVQKRTAEPGTVAISIVIDGATEESNSTSAAYGMAQVVHVP